MIQRILFATVLLAFLPAAVRTAESQVIYDSTVSPLPGNLPSVGAEAYAFRQLGDEVTFAGTARRLAGVTVTMSSWGCQSGSWFVHDCLTASGATFNVPITLNVYNATLAGVPGALIATRTQTFALPYRPSVDIVNCTEGRWFEVSSGTCFNGKAANITFDFTSTNVVLPNTAVYGIVYNTTDYGPSPIGNATPCVATSAGCPYDSLNIALAPSVAVGTKPYADTLFQDSPIASEYCDNGLAGAGTFRLDSPSDACWGGYIPAAKFNASNPPTTKDACKGSGWQTLTTLSGQPFTNQGQCIQYANTGK